MSANAWIGSDHAELRELADELYALLDAVDAGVVDAGSLLVKLVLEEVDLIEETLRVDPERSNRTEVRPHLIRGTPVTATRSADRGAASADSPAQPKRPRPHVSDLNRVVNGTLFGEAINDASVAALLATADGWYVGANDAVCHLTGYSREVLTDIRAGQLAADAESRNIHEAITRRRELEGVKTVRRRDGATLRCRYWAVPTWVAMAPHYILVLRPEASATAA